MDHPINDHMRESMDRLQETLSRLREAHHARMACLQNNDAGRVEAAMDDEREAIYEHADAIRRHSEELARLV